MDYVLPDILRNYRKQHKLSQAALAEMLDIDTRTERRYENGEATVRDVEVLTHIARVLDIDQSLLGVAVEGALGNSQADMLWNTVKHANFTLARATADKLLLTGNVDLDTLYAIAYVINHTSSNRDASLPLSLYRQVYERAIEQNDRKYQALGLTYVGDGLQRLEKVDLGIEILKEAVRISPDSSTKGNAQQLLARAYGKAGNKQGFDRAIKASMETAYEVESLPHAAALSSSKSTTRGQFNIATVLEEYGKYEGLNRKLDSAIDLLDKAELGFNKHWSKERSSMLLTSSRAVAFIKAGDFRTGSELAVEGIALSERYGNRRNLERIVGIMHYLDTVSRDAHKSSTMIRERLTGKVELY